MLGGLLAAAAGVPYVLSNPELKRQFQNAWQGIQGNGSGNSALENSWASREISLPEVNSGSSWSVWDLLGSDAPAASPMATQTPAPMVAPESIDYSQILRFDVVPEMILQRWPRVSNMAAEEGFSALRVPIVTGGRPDDLVGSLTYYFDNQRRCQRIILQGNSGDPRRLVTFVTQQHAFQPLPSLSAGMFVAVNNNQPQGLMQISYAPVIQQTDPLHRTSVVLELNRPGTQLSAAGRQLLEQDKLLSHW